MTAGVPWNDLVTGRTAAPRGSLPAEGPRRSRSLIHTSFEELVTLGLVLVALLSVSASLQEADWVSEMPSLFAAALVGLLSGWLLARVRLPAVALHLPAVAIGIVLVFSETLHTMRLEDPLAGDGVRLRWDELWARLGDWWTALLEGGISSDPLPFILLVVFVSWALAYLAAWSVFRWQNAWVAVIPGGFALLTNISYLPGQPSFAFILYLFAAILLVTRLQVLRETAQWREDRVVRPPLLSYEVLNVGTWVGLGLIVLAWVIPTANNWGPVADAWRDALSPVTERVDRLGRLFVGIDAKGNNLVHRYGDVLPLQGRVTLDADVLFTVVAPDDELYLRAAVYDEYTGQGWHVSSHELVPLIGTSVEAASFGTPSTRAQLRRPIVIDITLEQSVATRRLFTVGDPIAADRDASVLVGGQRADLLGLVPADRVSRGDTYATVGTVSAATVETLLSTGRDYPAWVTDRYLQLPAGLSPEIAALAIEAADGAEQPYVVARRIESFLRNQYRFDLTVPDPPPRADGVEFFLLETKAGYFDHHASAMAVMLRALGIPTRIAVGFTLDARTFDEETKAYQVSELSAWSWPEVYFAGLGWIEFNPTPARSIISRPGDDSAFLDAFAVLRLGVDPTVAVAFDPEEEFWPFDRPGLSTVDADEQSGPGGTTGEIIASVISAVILIAGVLVVAGILLRAGWQYWFRGLRPAARRWAKVQLLAGWAGITSPTNRTPIEVARTLDVALAGQSTVDIESLARSYARERYGPPPGDEEPEAREDDDETARLDETYMTARNRLFRRALRHRLFLRRRSAVGEPAGSGGSVLE